MMTKLKTSKQTLENSHIYGQLPNRLTPEVAKTLTAVILLILIFAVVMIYV